MALTRYQRYFVDDTQHRLQVIVEKKKKKTLQNYSIDRKSQYCKGCGVENKLYSLFEYFYNKRISTMGT